MLRRIRRRPCKNRVAAILDLKPLIRGPVARHTQLQIIVRKRFRPAVAFALERQCAQNAARLRRSELRGFLLAESAKGARFMFLDTCHSGNAYNPRALNESVNANILVYTAARWDQTANETARFGEGHGLFTMAIAEGVRGKAKTAEGEVRAEPLHVFLRRRVAEFVEAANKQIEAEQKAKPGAKLKKLAPQEPQFFKGRDAGNYLLAIAN